MRLFNVARTNMAVTLTYHPAASAVSMYLYVWLVRYLVSTPSSLCAKLPLIQIINTVILSVFYISFFTVYLHPFILLNTFIYFY